MTTQTDKNSITISRAAVPGKFLAKQRLIAAKIMDEIRKRHKVKKTEKSSVEIIREFRDKA